MDGASRIVAEFDLRKYITEAMSTERGHCVPSRKTLAERARRCAPAFLFGAMAGIVVALFLRITHQRFAGISSSEGIPSLALATANAAELGAVWAQTGFHWTLPLSNKTDRDVRIATFSTSCSCTSVEPKAITIPANETRNVSLTLDLTRGPMQPNADFRVKLTAHTSPVDGPLPRWELRGNVRRAFLIEPAMLDYSGSHQLVYGEPGADMTIRVTPVEDLLTIVPHYDAAVLDVEVQERSDPGPGWNVTVTPRSSISEGKFATTLALSARRRDGRALPEIPVHISGIVEADIYALPRVLSLVRTDDDSPEADVVLVSHSSMPFAVIDAQSDNHIFDIHPKPPSPAGTRHQFAIRPRHNRPGPIDDRLLFTVSRARDERERVIIPVKGYQTGADRARASDAFPDPPDRDTAHSDP